MPRRPLAAAAVFALLLSPSAPAETEEATRFEVHFGGLYAGRLTVALARDDDRYALRAQARPANWVSALYRAGLTAEGEGAVAATPRPERFEVRARFGDDDQRVAVDWGPDGRPASVAAEPPFRPRPWQLDPSTQQGAVDPVAAAVRFLEPRAPEALCRETVEVFDGRRRTRVTLGAPEAHRGGWRCRGSWERVAGFRPRDMRKKPVPVAVEFVPGPDGLAELRQVEVDTGYGVALVRRAAD